MKLRRAPGTAWALGALLVLLAACGGGASPSEPLPAPGPGPGGGGGGGPVGEEPGPPPELAIGWAPEATPGARSASLVLDPGRSSDTLLVLRLEVKDVTDLYGAAFEVVYPEQEAWFLGWERGDFLAAGGASFSLQVAEEPGRLLIGVSRLGDVGGVSGSGSVLVLCFTPREAGEGIVGFASPEAFDRNATPIALDWLGGVIEVTEVAE